MASIHPFLRSCFKRGGTVPVQSQPQNHADQPLFARNFGGPHSNGNGCYGNIGRNDLGAKPLSQIQGDWKRSSHFVPTLFPLCSSFLSHMWVLVPILVPLLGSCSHFVPILVPDEVSRLEPLAALKPSLIYPWGQVSCLEAIPALCLDPF